MLTGCARFWLKSPDGSSALKTPHRYNFKMPRLLYGNFDFEHHLTGAGAPSPDSKLGRINAELTPALIALADEEDYLWCPAPFDESHLNDLTAAGMPRPRLVTAGASLPRDLSLVPWGWSDVALKLATQTGASAEHPPLEVVKQANCRRVAYELETRWNCGLDGAAEICHLDELARVIEQSANFSLGWVLKARFGMSGRERHLGSGVEVETPTINWAKKRLARDGAVLFEPWVQRIDEAGLQFEIPRDGEPQLLGITPQLCDATGHYRGSRLTISAAAATAWQTAVDVGRRLAVHMQQTGYFGPLGIDAMRYRDQQGEIRIRPLQDINARLTMGRLAWGFRRCLVPGEAGAWLHFPFQPLEGSEDSPWEHIRRKLPADCRIIPTSPATIGGQPPKLMHLIVAAPTESALADVEQLLV
ncbi:[Butirosin acyl-carrier protein]--L-glutamate ligase [Symmachiella dynata]|uniref:[Butirosin acyl-carrier protein]--L-glutamate ligase n=2 Tax=Symmachiella dynata TaxID=2527995 RepID=A0A517ZM79_9PLAN|nr:[Butirosin acyl-carrier protein]--L-glutamate ligase [Symmachiella dynata]